MTDRTQFSLEIDGLLRRAQIRRLSCASPCGDLDGLIADLALCDQEPTVEALLRWRDFRVARRLHGRSPDVGELRSHVAYLRGSASASAHNGDAGRLQAVVDRLAAR